LQLYKESFAVVQGVTNLKFTDIQITQSRYTYDLYSLELVEQDKG
jgi:hypothetical protein